MNVGILGSGFGLYGYLPALCRINATPILLEKTRNILESRIELRQFIDKVFYVDSENELVSLSTRLIIARKPEQQELFLLKNKSYPSIEHLYLEKPLTSILNTRDNITRILETRSYSVAYLFIYTNWYNQIQKLLKNKRNHKIIIKWNVKIQDSSWKSNPSEGGGLLFNYGIHFFAMLWKLGVIPSDITVIHLEDIIFQAKGTRDNHIEVGLKYHKEPFFSVDIITNSNIHKNIYKNKTPFGEIHMIGSLDARVDLIAKYLKEPVDKLAPEAKQIEEFITNLLKIISLGDGN